MNWSLNLIIKLIGDRGSMPVAMLIEEYNKFLVQNNVGLEYSEKLKYNNHIQYRIGILREQGLVEPRGTYRLTPKGVIVYETIKTLDWKDWE